ncbi:hypothetical protein IAD21_01505 [Abditibacteriota bacterium]|nr:hypothetical protein IAD21_01505 [Abditibacteriota bacterium]
MNPLFRREFFARWRDRRSHLLLLALSLLLAIAAYRSYENAINFTPLNIRVYPATPIAESLATRASRAGHALFSTLAIGNVGIWFVLAPLLLATGVARERERGLLESLQLSPMRPASQIMARTLSALSYLAILQFVTLPIYFVAFSFGGVSEDEILRVWEIVAASAFCGVGLGLALSAQSPRPSSALFGAVALLVVWSLVSIFGGNFSLWLWFLGLGRWVGGISGTLYFIHPLILVMSLCEPLNTGSFAWGKLFPEEALPWSLLGWSVIGVLGLVKATRDVTRPLPPTGWAGHNTLIQKWRKRREDRLKAQREKRRATVSVEGALLADLPFDRLIRFKNPLLNREVKSRFRLRRASAWVWTGRAVIFLAGACLWVMVFFSVFFDPPGRPGAVPLVLWGEWLLGMALVGTFAASSFAREREAGTWEGIRLSLMTSGEVTRTKWASPLVAFAFLSCPLWLLLFALLPVGSWSGVPFRWILLGSLVVVSSLCWVSALGSWISLRAKSTASATCWTIGVLLALLVAAPYVAENLSISNRIALWRYGMSGELSNRVYDSPQSREIYAQQTGIQIPRLYSNGKMPTPAEQQQWARYYEWFRQKELNVRLFQRTLCFWSPIDVLTELQNRGRNSYSPTYGSLTLDDETIATMALLHIGLAGIGTLTLLLAVNARLKKHSD